MASFNDSFDALLDFEEWERIAVIFAGFLAPTVAKNVIEPNSPYDIPDEVYGLLVMAGSQYSPMYQNEMLVGGGLYVADQAAERVGLKSSVTEMGA